MREGYIIQSFTDATGAPGMMKCIVPDNPTGTPNSRCGEGEITIGATSTSNDAVIDWYDAATGSTVLSGGSATDTFTPTITSSTTYYAQARDMITHCVSATRTPVVATINTIPGLVLSSGTATSSQTVDQNKPIADIIYTAASATIALSSGTAGLPAGVSGTSSGIPSSGTTFTISGTPTAAGTFNYTVTATHTDGGCTNTLSGAIMVRSGTPPYAVTAQTWTFGSSTLIWSDRINTTQINCTQVNQTSSSGTTAEYLIIGGKYFYNWYCVVNNQTTLCPSPWSVPDLNKINTLSGATSKSTLNTQWGTTGVVDPGLSALSYTQHMYMWSTASYDDLNSQYIETGNYWVTYRKKVCAMTVRCVK
jgi:hypothetical protein